MSGVPFYFQILARKLNAIGMTCHCVMQVHNIQMYNLHVNFIDGVIVSVLTSSEVDCGSEPQSGQTKDYEISMCCFFAKQATFHDSESG